jgi:hypothetical protein
MAVIAQTSARGTHGPFTITETTLGASDTFVRDTRFKQFLVLRNPTGGSLTLTIDGDGGSNVNAPGLGVVAVGGGTAVVVAAGAHRWVNLSTIEQYLQGTITCSGASGLVAAIVNL